MLTRPDSNLSYQIYVPSADGKQLSAITCPSPAEVAKSYSVSANVTGGLSKGAATGLAPSLSVAGAQATSESNTIVSSQDAATHFLASASFYNCLFYASAIYCVVGEPSARQTATEMERLIITNAVQVQQAAAATASSKTSATAASAPAAPSGVPTVTALLTPAGTVVVSFNPVNDTTVTGYTVTSIHADASVSDGVDAEKRMPTPLHVVSGLTSGKPYTFTVSAIAPSGTSKPSTASVSVTPN